MLYALIVTVFFSMDTMPVSTTVSYPTLKSCVQAEMWVEKHYPHATAVCRQQA